MNRRNIVHSVAAERPVGALSPNGEGASPPAPATLAFRAGVISINAGAKALECLISNPHLSSTRIVALDAQPLSFVNTVDLVHISIGAERVFSGDEPAVRKITHEQMKALIAAISEVDVVFVVFQPGERCELNNAIAIASTLQEKGIPGFGIALLPFAFSKMPTLRNATEELHTLSEYLTTFPVSRDDLLRRRIKDPDSDTVTNMSAQIAEQASDVSRVDVPAAIERIIYSVIAPEICETRVSYDLSEVITYLDGCRIAFVGPRWPGKIPHPWPGENPPPDRGVIKEKPPFFASSAGLLAGRNLCPSIEGNWIERLETAFTNDDSHAA